MQRGENPVMARKVRGPKMRISGFPVLEPLCNAFATIAATHARKLLRRDVEVAVLGYETERHGSYLQKLPAPSAITILEFPEASGAGLVRAHPDLMHQVIRCLLGGGDGESAGASRELTRIDISIFGRFVDVVAGAFHDALVEICGKSGVGRPVRARFEDQPGMVRIAPDRAPVFIIKLGFRIGEDERNLGLDFALPLSTLELLKEDLARTATTDAEILALWERAMRERVMDLPLRAECVIDLGAFSVGELSRLEQGALIELPHDAINAIELRVPTAAGEFAFAHGRLGATGRHKAVRLNDDPDAGFLQPLRTDQDEPLF